MRVVLVWLLLGCCFGLPYVERMLLVNSMMVGHNNDMDIVNWDCQMCRPDNRPNHAHYI